MAHGDNTLRCAPLCDDLACPDGSLCVPVEGQFRCVDRHVALCAPCDSNAACALPGTGGACVAQGPGGKDGGLCGVACQKASDCQTGFVCEDTTDIAGQPTRQCLPGPGVLCSCTPWAKAAGATTTCTGATGCTGTRGCTDEGAISVCDVPDAATETCNGLDDDCDGQVDEFEAGGGGPCDDGDPCTDDVCDSAAEACNHIPATGPACDDGDPCTQGDLCLSGICAGSGNDCDDGNPCTDDGCTLAGACTSTFNLALCDDGDACTGPDLCAMGSCGGPSLLCDDGVGCTDDGCDVALGCTVTANNSVCEDGELCTVNACDSKLGCITSALNGIACDDGSVCSEGEVCKGGGCFGVPTDCDDGNTCTADSCDKVAGCKHLPSPGPCDDGDPCTADDACQAGACAAGAPTDCDDGDDCSQDSCAPGVGCLAAPIDDGTSCGPSGELCVSGVCNALPDPAWGSAVEAGNNHVCAVAGGQVWCWGNGQSGKLGDGGGAPVGAPKLVAGLPASGAVGLGALFTCALGTDGGVRCWGDGGSGQLGHGKTADSAVPVLAAGLVDATGVAVGNTSVCAHNAAGAVWCWGGNSLGQLGNGTTSNSAVPVNPLGLPPVAGLLAGHNHYCAYTSGGEASAGSVYCWGYNAYGQAGTGSTSPTKVTQAALVPGLADAIGGDGGYRHICALRAGGKVSCWGENGEGQLGVGDKADSASPKDVSLPAPALQVSAGFEHSCAVAGDGDVYCWGRNHLGQLGDGTTTSSTTPVAVQGIGGPTKRVVAGQHFSCALRVDGALRCWGGNGDLQLGDEGASGGSSTTPVDVLGTSPGAACANNAACDDGDPCTFDVCDKVCLAIAKGPAQACDDGDPCTEAGVCGPGGCQSGVPITCDDGDPCTDDACDPAQGQCASTPAADGTYCGVGLVCSQAACVPEQLKPWATGIVAGHGSTCAVRIDGTLACWGENSAGQVGVGSGPDEPLPTVVSSLPSPVSSPAPWWYHGCAIAAGKVWCWGSNANGKLGNGGVPVAGTPIALPAPLGAVQVDTGDQHACARTAAGAVWCWGSNDKGACGTGALSDPGDDVTVPTATAINDATALCVGKGHSCVVRTGGEVWCWGANDKGQLGVGFAPAATGTPTKVAGVQGVVELGCGAGFTCGRGIDGSVSCWGANDVGQLAVAGGAPSASPVPVLGLNKPAAALRLGSEHACVRLTDQTVWCWGGNSDGQVGTGDTIDRTAPSAVLGLADTTVLSLGHRHTCAVRGDNVAFCWGDNSSGQLGVGIVGGADALLPVAVSELPPGAP